MSHLQQHIEQHDYPLHLSTCLTTCVENCHAVTHFKDDTQTHLQYARNLANTVFEGLKRSVDWAAYYYTHPQSYYPVPHLTMQLVDLPQLSHLKPNHELRKQQQEVMLKWANK